MRIRFPCPWGMSLTARQNREIDRKVPMIAGQGPSLSLSQACGQLSLVSEGDSEGNFVCIGAPTNVEGPAVRKRHRGDM